MSTDEEFSYRGTINRELASQYEKRWSDPEADVSNNAAAAARATTQLRNMQRQFAGVLDAQQMQALSAATAVTAKLANDLKALKPWAKALVTWRMERAKRDSVESQSKLSH